MNVEIKPPAGGFDLHSIIKNEPDTYGAKEKLENALADLVNRRLMMLTKLLN